MLKMLCPNRNDNRLSLSVFLIFCIVTATGLNLNQSDLCFHHNSSCKHQLRCISATEEDCLMTYFPRNTEACEALEFSGSGLREDLGTVELLPYFYKNFNHQQTAFNVTFNNIKWKFLRMRFRQNAVHSTINTCREFTLSDNLVVPSSSKVFYDCLWSHEEYETKTFIFEYMAQGFDKKEMKTYIFNVPLHGNIDPNTTIDQWKVFSYVETTSYPQLNLMLLKTPEKFEVKKYNISVWWNGELSSVKEIAVEDSDTDIFKFHYNVVSYSGGIIKFGVQPIHPDCGPSGCLMSQSPDITIAKPEALYVTIAIYCTVILMIILFILLWKFCWKNRSYKTQRTVLIIYNPTHDLHVKAVRILAEFLSRNCQVNVEMDQISIPRSGNMDPFTWLSKAFEEAHCVIVVASPECQQQVTEVIYRNLYEVGLTFLREKLAGNHSGTKFFTVLLPYCSQSDIPMEAINLRRFKLLKDLNRLVNCIHSVKAGALFQYMCSLHFSACKFKAIEELNLTIKEIQHNLGNCPRSARACSQTPDDRLFQIEEELPFIVPSPEPVSEERMDKTVGIFPFDIHSLNLHGAEEEVVVRQKNNPQPGEINLLSLRL